MYMNAHRSINLKKFCKKNGFKLVTVAEGVGMEATLLRWYYEHTINKELNLKIRAHFKSVLKELEDLDQLDFLGDEQKISKE